MKTLRGCLNMRKEVYEARTYIMEHFRDDLTWEVVGASVGLSGRYLRTLYMEVYDDSLRKTLMECRMRYAAALLIRTTLSISDISTDSRYEDSAYFCKLFKEWSGMTPTEFRRKYSLYEKTQERSTLL